MYGCASRKEGGANACANGLSVRREIALGRDVNRARAIIRQLVGEEIRVVPDEAGKHLVAHLPFGSEALLQASGGSQIFVVAGPGFEPGTFGL